MAAVDSGNAAAMTDLFANDAQTTLVEDGEVWRGWAAIRARLDSVAATHRLYGIRLKLGAIDVTALSSEYALAIVRYTEMLAPDSQYPRVMTVVFRRTGVRWRGIHVHVSTRPPPE